MNNQRDKEIKGLLKKCGFGVHIDSSAHIIVPQQLEIGDNTSISSFTTIFATYGVKIGHNCLISSNCGISSYNHIPNSYNRTIDVQQDCLYSKSVIIGDNVWIAMNVCILPGVTIGNNSIIGSGSVVTKNVPPNELWGGNPAKYIKTLFI